MSITHAARYLFIPAALFNASVAASLLLLGEPMTALLNLDPARGTNLAIRDMCMLLVGLFAYVYGRVAFAPERFRNYIELGILGKCLVLLVINGHWLAGNIGWQLPAVALGDALFVVLFWRFLRRYPAPNP